jgi:phage terminase large subunit-like protein
LTPEEVLQLHGCVWTSAFGSWFREGEWQQLARPDIVVPDSAPRWLGVDVGVTHDTTAVAEAIPLPTGVHHRTRVFSANRDVVAHEYHDKRVDLIRVQDHILDMCQRYPVRGVVYDPRFMEPIAQVMSARGVKMIEMPQNSRVMRDAEQSFYAAVRDGRGITHNGDPVLAAHVAAVVAQRTDRGWKIRRRAESNVVIDAAVAAIMAHSVAAARPQESIYQHNDLKVI